jgi:hypothetical protein
MPSSITIPLGKSVLGTLKATDDAGNVCPVTQIQKADITQVKYEADPSDPTNPLKFKLTAIATGTGVLWHAATNSMNVQLHEQTTITVPPNATVLTATYTTPV